MNRTKTAGHFMMLQNEVKVYIKGVSLQLVEQGLSEIFKELHFFYIKQIIWVLTFTLTWLNRIKGGKQYV